jgi:alpha-galactosidase/6-phospho-beta-glucosidase family protein
MCGDEGLGPGGLAAAWRTWPELERVLARINHIRPQALVILLTSPIGILTRCARQAFPALRVYGICELPWVTLQQLCSLRVGSDRASFAYVAVNHLGWFSNVSNGEMQVLTADDVYPLKYVQLLDAPSATLAEQRKAGSRAIELDRLASCAFRTYQSGTYADIIGALRARATPWYGEAVGPLIAAVGGDQTDAIFFLTTVNAGYCSQFADDDTLEIPHIVRGGRLERCMTLPWQHGDVADRLAALIAYERLAARAVQSRDVGLTASALHAHPAVGDRLSDALVNDVLSVVPSISGSQRT